VREEVLELSLSAVAAALARGDISSRVVTEASIERARREGARLNCVLGLATDRALQRADWCDSELSKGRLRGPLHGVPLAHKDIFEVRGECVTVGRSFDDAFVPSKTATVIRRLTAAGSVNVGRLHLAELALSPTGRNDQHGYCLNPWNPGFVSGGSSSGSAAAVAARITYGSLGTDTGGSIRHPAAMCGVTGLKPTQGLTSVRGLCPLAPSLDCVGPIARSAEDCARLLGVIAEDRARGSLASRLAPKVLERELSAGIRGLRIGLPPRALWENTTANVRAPLERAVEVLRSLGVRPVSIDPLELEAASSLGQIIFAVEARRACARILRQRHGKLGREVRARLAIGAHYGSADYRLAKRIRPHVTWRFVNSVFRHADILLTPAIAVETPSLHEATQGDLVDSLQRNAALTTWTRPFNYLGLPCLVMPIGFTPRGLPVACQLVGPPFAESLLLRAAHTYQMSTPWHTLRPLQAIEAS
jgi:aspartyl-tRNA(Asn)/glutamyl-tRNA(Gln) amidotransferase subunit A